MYGCRTTCRMPTCSRATSGGMMAASMTAWICSFVPAVMFEMVQQASFLMLFLWFAVSRVRRQLRAPQLMTTWVCMSLPVTILPTVRRAGTRTAGDECLHSRRHEANRFSASSGQHAGGSAATGMVGAAPSNTAPSQHHQKALLARGVSFGHWDWGCRLTKEDGRLYHLPHCSMPYNLNSQQALQEHAPGSAWLMIY